eukprot:gene5021-4187_t
MRFLRGAADSVSIAADGTATFSDFATIGAPGACAGDGWFYFELRLRR